jgi:hypothetical protein
MVCILNNVYYQQQCQQRYLYVVEQNVRDYIDTTNKAFE